VKYENERQPKEAIIGAVEIKEIKPELAEGPEGKEAAKP